MIHQPSRCRRAGVALGAAALGAALIAPAFTALSPAHAATRARDATIQLVGAGSTFDNPFFQFAFARYAKAHPVQVNYQPIGSGGGIKQFIQGTVDFGATDVPMNASELAQAGANTARGGQPVQVPVALGGEALAYNLPGVKSGQLRLDSDTLVKIFEGKITSWSDPAIKKLNPTLNLPGLAILPVHRSDGSGTTYIFTDYLSSVSSDWAKSIGTGKDVAWPSNELGGKGNEGVAAGVQQHQGAIGYVELAYAIQYHMSYARLKNKAGAFLLPSKATVAADAAQKPKVSATDFSIVNQGGKQSYPISGYSWALIRSHLNNASHRRAVIALFRWAVTDGQTYASQLDYVPLPKNVQKVADTALGQIQQ